METARLRSPEQVAGRAGAEAPFTRSGPWLPTSTPLLPADRESLL